MRKIKKLFVATVITVFHRSAGISNSECKSD